MKMKLIILAVLLGILASCSIPYQIDKDTKYKTVKIEHKWIGIENSTDYDYNPFSGRLSPVSKSRNVFMIITTTGEEFRITKQEYFKKEVGDTIQVADYANYRR